LSLLTGSNAGWRWVAVVVNRFLSLLKNAGSSTTSSYQKNYPFPFDLLTPISLGL